MGRWDRRERERMDDRSHGRRFTERDESGDGENFAATYRSSMGMSPLPASAGPLETAAPIAAAKVDERIPRFRRLIAECEAKGFLTAADKDQLAFYRGLLAKLEAEG
jgi:hypothetical protein